MINGCLRWVVSLRYGALCSCCTDDSIFLSLYRRAGKSPRFLKENLRLLVEFLWWTLCHGQGWGGLLDYHHEGDIAPWASAVRTYDLDLEVPVLAAFQIGEEQVADLGGGAWDSDVSLGVLGGAALIGGIWHGIALELSFAYVAGGAYHYILRPFGRAEIAFSIV